MERKNFACATREQGLVPECETDKENRRGKMRISRDRMANWDIKRLSPGLTELIPPRDYSNLNEQGAQLRIWLPEPARVAMEEMAEMAESSMTVYLTEYFASYLYGEHELQRMQEKRIGLYEPSRVKYSRMSTGPRDIPTLGKNIYALKIFVPEKIKQALMQLAERAGLTLGEFARGLICAHLFGQAYGPRNAFEIAEADARVAADWEAEANIDDYADADGEGD